MPVHGIFTRKDVKACEMSGAIYLFEALQAEAAYDEMMLVAACGHDRLRQSQRVGETKLLTT